MIFLLTVLRRWFFCGYFLLFMFHVCSVLSLHYNLVITCWTMTGLLALLFPCVLSLSHMVSRVRCGTWLYRYLIFAFFFTFRWLENGNTIINDSINKWIQPENVTIKEQSPGKTHINTGKPKNTYLSTNQTSKATPFSYAHWSR